MSGEAGVKERRSEPGEFALVFVESRKLVERRGEQRPPVTESRDSIPGGGDRHGTSAVGVGQPDVYIDLGEILNPSDMSAITVVESPALADDPISSGYNSATIVVELRDPTTSFEFNGTDALITE